LVLGAKTGFLWVAALLALLPVLISGFRWRILLGTLGIHLPAARLALICQIGQFFGVLVPGTAGDDGTRLLYVSRLAPGRAGQACSTVLLDRFIGFCCLFVLSLFGIPLNWDLLGAESATRALAAAFLAAGFGVVAGWVLLFCLKTSQLGRLVGFVRTRFRSSKIVEEWAAAANIFVRHRFALLGVAGAAMCTQILICANYWLIGAAVGIELPFSAWASFVPVIVLAGVLPITFAGIGVRDYLLFLFLGISMNGEGDRLAALSMLLLSFTLFSALLGGGCYLFYRSKTDTREVLQQTLAVKN
jgi:uncharacterized protein (TIRG00374 family)